MDEFYLDCRSVEEKSDICKGFAHFLSVPEWYCSNLDAIFDCLGDVFSAKTIHLTHTAALEERLGRDYADRFFSMLSRAAAENPFIELIMD